MKYLVLGPACMAIFSLIGGLKAMESDLAGVEEISGSSAGSILALFLAVGMSVDEILEATVSVARGRRHEPARDAEAATRRERVTRRAAEAPAPQTEDAVST